MKARKAFELGILTIGLAIGFNTPVNAQNFRENQDLWTSEIIRAKSMDTIRIEKHSFFSLPALSDTSVLVYHEPMPDSVMPKAAIEIGVIAIQAGSAEEVLEMIESQARHAGADWIIGFNEPRRKFTKTGDLYYRSEATLYKVIDPELVPQSQIVEISCGENHLQNCAAVESFVKHTVAKSDD